FPPTIAQSLVQGQPELKDSRANTSGFLALQSLRDWIKARRGAKLCGGYRVTPDCIFQTMPESHWSVPAHGCLDNSACKRPFHPGGLLILQWSLQSLERNFFGGEFDQSPESG